MYVATCYPDDEFPYCDESKDNDTYDLVVVQTSGNAYQLADLSRDFLKVNASTFDLNSNQFIFVAATNLTQELVVYEGNQQVARHTVMDYPGRSQKYFTKVSTNSEISMP